MAILDSFIGIAGGVLKHRNTIQLILRDYFNKDILKSLSDSRLFVSEDIIRNEVMRIEKASDLVEELHCDPDGIVVKVHGKSYGAAVEAQVRLRIRRLILSESTQILVIEVTEQSSPAGKNFIGKIVCSVGTALIGNLTSYALKNGNLGEHACYDDREKAVTVRLNELPAMQRLLEPQVPSWKDSVPLRLVGVEDAVHVSKGVEMCLMVSPYLKIVQEGMSPAVGVAKEFLLSKYKRT